MQNPFANVPALDEIIREDWVFVATDYVGLGTAGVHAYLVGEEAARAVLDAITAAREMDGLLMDTSAVVWGHSQGGNTALWTAMRAATYAPGLQVAGVAALAPATDLPALVTSAKGSLFGKIVSTYLLDAYATTYPDVSNKDYAARGTDWLRADIASRCVGEWATLFSVLEAWLLPSGGIFARDPTTGPLGSRLRENTPLGPFAAPLLIAQGDLDDLVLPAVQRGWVDGRCAAGQSLDFRVMPGLDHISLVAPASPIGAQLITWSKERFARRPPADTCKR
jgi:acetyl esterase/lipase